ncbi:MAG: hypothetical protein NVSMB14_05790 [Isosphaeraceae bacterium]
MSAPVLRRPASLRDIDDAADFIRRQSGPKRAIRFLRDADDTFTLLASKPLIGMRYDSEDERFVDLRVFSFSRFKKYIIFYRPTAGGIEVFRVLHGARDLHEILAGEFELAPDAEEATPAEADE